MDCIGLCVVYSGFLYGIHGYGVALLMVQSALCEKIIEAGVPVASGLGVGFFSCTVSGVMLSASHDTLVTMEPYALVPAIFY